MMKKLLVVAALLVAPAAYAAPKNHKLPPQELETITKEAIASSHAKLLRGTTVVGVKTLSPVEVPSYATVVIDVATPARRAGKGSTSATLTFSDDTHVVARAVVTLLIDVPAESIPFDAPKGTPITVTVKRGLVEVSSPAVVAADADVGDVVGVMLRPSGRVMRARLVEKGRAVAEEA